MSRPIGKGHCKIMGHRVIAGLMLANACERPKTIPLARLRGTKRMGIKYENDFAKALKRQFPGAVLCGQWFHFVDNNGSGYCQTDLLVKLAGECIIFECKLTDTERGRSQLSRLYFPVVGKCYGLPTRGMVVTRHLSGETQLELVTDQLATALSSPRDIIPTLHWRERNPL